VQRSVRIVQRGKKLFQQTDQLALRVDRVGHSSVKNVRDFPVDGPVGEIYVSVVHGEPRGVKVASEPRGVRTLDGGE
jgi:hypothetical protein